MSVLVRIGSELLRVDAPDARHATWRVSRDGGDVTEVDADISEVQPGVLSILIGGRSHIATLDTLAGEQNVLVDGVRTPFTVEDPRSLASRRTGAQGADGPKSIVSPMPGRVVRILAEAGSQVAARQGVLVVEAMKMQNEIKSPKDGVVSALLVKPGDTVAAGQPLATIA